MQHLKTLTLLLAITLVSLSFKKQETITQLYKDCGLENKMTLPIFEKAMLGKSKITLSNSNIISIIDFTKPSTAKRFFVIDIINKKILFETYIAHGKNSGENYATSFSNKEGSLKSSLGFYKTLETYNGSHGFSLQLDGVEKGFNSNAKSRAIVIHAADYVSEDFIKQNGRLGRSWGCPALNKEVYKLIINTIKKGSCLFIYANNNEYLTNSTYLN
jgi:L,D-transpeptidase catalytic domain